MWALLVSPVSHLADKHPVSWMLVYQQGDKAQQALDESFAPSQGDDEVLFHLPVTKNWLKNRLGLPAASWQIFKRLDETPFNDCCPPAIAQGCDRTRFFTLLEQPMIRAGLKNVGTSLKSPQARQHCLRLHRILLIG